MIRKKHMLILLPIFLFSFVLIFGSLILGALRDINEYIFHGMLYLGIMLAVFCFFALVIGDLIFGSLYKMYLGIFGGRSVAKIISVEFQNMYVEDHIPLLYVGIEYEILDKYRNKKKEISSLDIPQYPTMNIQPGQKIEVVYNKMMPKSIVLESKVEFAKSPLKLFIRIFIMLLFLTGIVKGCNLIKNTPADPGNDKISFSFLTGLSKLERHEKGKLIYESNSTLLGKVGIAKEYYLNGQIKSERFYKKGKVIGPIKYYYENGNLQKVEEKEEKYNQLIKLSIKTYYENGKLESELSKVKKDEEYKEDKYVSIYKEYSENENIILEEYVDENTWIKKEYYENGLLNREILDNKKTKETVFKNYYKSGQLKRESFHKNSKQDGVETQFYENGNKYLEIPMKNDKIHGRMTRYKEDGTIFWSTLYDEGEEVK